MKLGRAAVAITGGGGFFGMALSERLCEMGVEVKALDVFPKGVPARLQKLKERFKDQISVVHCDVTTDDKLKESLSAADYIVHLAAIANPRVCNSNLELAYKVNVDGLRNVLGLAPQVEKLLFTSSILVYGGQSEIPVKETARTNCNDNYGLLKLMGEHLCRVYSNSRGTPFVVVRMAYAYGAWQSYDYIVSSLILQALNTKKMEVWDPRPIRDFIYVDDAVSALVGVLLADNALCETVNVGSGTGTSVLELASTLSQLLDVPVVDVGRRQQTPLRLVADISKIWTLTKWKPSTELKAGLERTVAWMKDNRPT